MAVRRDRYGRFRGKGGIKAYKSNLKPGKGRKKVTRKSPAKRKAPTKMVPAPKVGNKRQTAAFNPSAGKPTKNGGWSKKKKAAVFVGASLGVAAAANVYGKEMQDRAYVRRSQAAGPGKKIPGAPVRTSVPKTKPVSKAYTMAEARAQYNKEFGKAPGVKKAAAATVGKTVKPQGAKAAVKRTVISDQDVKSAEAITKRYTAGDKSVSFAQYDKATLLLARADTIAQGHVYPNIVRKRVRDDWRK